MARAFESIKDPDRRSTLLWGQSQTLSRRVVIVAVVLLLFVAAVRFVSMSITEELVYLDLPRGSLEFVPWQAFNLVADHPVLIVGLAVVAAYLNEGFLPTVLLAVAPFIGVSIWIYSGAVPGPYVLTLKPLVGEWGWVWSVVSSAVPWAIVGFLGGLLVRWLPNESISLSEPT